jgi:hypothetical protein
MFIDSIKNIYSQEENSGAGSSLLIVIIILIIFYFYLKVSQTQVIIDWKNQKCNPKYMFFSYYMNPVEGQDPYKSTKNNFIQCIKPYLSIKKSQSYKDFNNTTKNIGKNTENLSKYVNIINQDMENKINHWSDDHKKLDKEGKNINNEASERYSKEKDMFEQIRIYAQRIHDVLYSITFYVKNKLLYQVSENKRNFKLQKYKNKRYNIDVIDVNVLNRGLYSEYASICNNEYNRAFRLLQEKRKEPNFDPQRTDFSKAINAGYDAIERYQELIDMIDAFNRQNNTPNNSLLKNTRNKCNQLQQFGFNCKEIYPNWSPQNLPA